MELGRLKNVELRNIWKHEALDFTKWLAKKENIALLGKEIGIDTEINNLEWDYLEERKTDKIILNYGDKVSNDIDSAYTWLLNNANKFKDVFLKYLNK